MRSLREFNWRTRDLSPEARGEAFDRLHEDLQAALWAQLEAECDARNERERRGEATHTLADVPGYGMPDEPADRPAERSTRSPSRASTGRRVRVVRCPFPEHADRDSKRQLLGRSASHADPTVALLSCCNEGF